MAVDHRHRTPGRQDGVEGKVPVLRSRGRDREGVDIPTEKSTGVGQAEVHLVTTARQLVAVPAVVDIIQGEGTAQELALLIEEGL